MNLSREKIDHCVEVLCQRGCRQVRADIEALSAGQVFAEVEGLDEEERRRVLDELRSIMAAYKGECSGP